MKPPLATLSALCFCLLLAIGCVAPSGQVESHASMIVLAGDQQSGVVGTELRNPIVVRALNANGRPLAGQSISFVVTTPAEISLSPDGGADRPATVQRTGDPFNGTVFAPSAVTGSNGVARTFWTLGTRTNVPQSLEARAVNASGKLVFARVTATPLAGPPQNLVASPRMVVPTDGSFLPPSPGELVKGAAGAQVLDRYGNPVPGVNVGFEVTGGGGSASPVSAITDGAGRAQTDLRLGLTPNTINEITVSAPVPTFSRQRITVFVGCPAGHTFCTFNTGVCLDLEVDGNNCGRCGDVCGAGSTCRGGVCQCPTAGESFCANEGRCVDVRTDARNCGGCGNSCPAGALCREGRCIGCSAGLIYCAAAGGCVHPLFDVGHCGGCNRACKAGATCVQGQCHCQPPAVECGAACADPRWDPRHCGGCNLACGSGAPFCDGGRCRPCPGGAIECAAACVSPMVDLQNCGGCGVRCALNQACVQGVCVSGM